MTQFAVALKTITDNGHERRTDGVWSHLGRIVVGGANTQTLTSVLQTNGQHVISGQPPALSSQSYSQTQLQLTATAPGLIGIGFHEGGAVGLLLYKPQGGAGLRIRIHDGTDYPLVGAPNSAQQRIGAYSSGTGWTSGGAVNTWIETDVRTPAMTCSGAECRIEWSVCVNNNGASGAATYFGIGWDGTMNYQIGFVNSPGTGYFMQVSGSMYTMPSAGTHRLGLFVYPTSGTVAFRSDVYNSLWVYEQKA